MRVFTALIFAVAIVVAAFVLGNAFKNRNKPHGSISVTGLGETNFTSDLIVWDGNFSKENTELKTAYAGLEADKNIIREYLISKGVNAENIVFSSVHTMKNTRQLYTEDGRYIGEEFLGYNLTQAVTIESGEVSKIEKISREITELLNKGVQFYSQPPRYYYTKLADLKIELISKSTEDARTRAEKIAEHSGAALGKLISGQAGIFQITAQNSNEEYSWGGTFNTAAKEKTASITMRLSYEVE